MDIREKETILSECIKVTAIQEIANIFAVFKNIACCNIRTHYLMRTKLSVNKRKLHEVKVDTSEETREADTNLFLNNKRNGERY